MSHRWPMLLTALWWGGMTSLSFVAVPMLFAQLGNPALAGPVAAKLFQLQSWFSVVVSLVLLLWARHLRNLPDQAALARGLLPALLLAALAALLQEYGVAHQIVTARATGGHLRLWHSVGTVLVLLQWLCALRVLWLLACERKIP